MLVLIQINTEIFPAICWGIRGSGQKLRRVVFFHILICLSNLSNFLSEFHYLFGARRDWKCYLAFLSLEARRSSVRHITPPESREQSCSPSLISNLWLPPAGTAGVFHSITSSLLQIQSNENSLPVTACESRTEITSVHLVGLRTHSFAGIDFLILVPLLLDSAQKTNSGKWILPLQGLFQIIACKC